MSLRMGLMLGGLVSLSAIGAELKALYEPKHSFEYADLVVKVQGYPVPTLDAFRGWMLLNNTEDQIEEVYRYFTEHGVSGEIPWHLVMLQGTDWAGSGMSLFKVPERADWYKMARTLKFIEQYVIPQTGPLIPVSGDRTAEYNQAAGGAPRSKHLTFCAVDLVPVESISRQDLHRKLQAIYCQHGREHQMGLGLYGGVRFHIDTCGYRQW
uniref:D-Ala-D-Ala carboxypeptidase family metallohydrolase n=1 Tax=Thaumasiovibrio occultus TaxID=1891184 RepID=UPI000B34BFB8|nr:D-Ala-D-Ala carboxypeptidase family metallohydrolase [Thaumasiovibrio occultus]